MTRPRCPRVRLELEILDADQDADYRIKRLLKFALRVLRLRCRSVVEVENDPG